MASKVYISHNNPPMVAPLPGNMEQIKGVSSCVGKNAFELVDGSTVRDVDTFIFCTGYAYDFSFLSDEGRAIQNIL
jgi:hypothetical protein